MVSFRNCWSGCWCLYCDYFYGNRAGIRYWLGSGFVRDGVATGCNIGSANNEGNWIAWNLGACDQLWNGETGFTYGSCGEHNGHPPYVGVTSIAFIRLTSFVFYVGACDKIWMDNGTGYALACRVGCGWASDLGSHGIFSFNDTAFHTTDVGIGACCDIGWTGHGYCMVGCCLFEHVSKGGCFCTNTAWEGLATLYAFGACDNMFNHKFQFGMFCVGGMQIDEGQNGFTSITFHPEWDAIYYFGACDYFWGNSSGIFYIVCGCSSIYSVDGGCLSADLAFVSYAELWDLGARHCDYIWGDHFTIRYGIYGGRCGQDLSCGLSSVVMIDGAWQAGWAVGACDKLNLFTGVGLVEVGGRYSYEDVAGLFGFSLPSWYGYTGVGACDYGWMYEAVIGISYVGGHCQNFTACGCCAYAHAGTGSIPWFLGAC